MSKSTIYQNISSFQEIVIFSTTFYTYTRNCSNKFEAVCQVHFGMKMENPEFLRDEINGIWFLLLFISH